MLRLPCCNKWELYMGCAVSFTTTAVIKEWKRTVYTCGHQGLSRLPYAQEQQLHHVGLKVGNKQEPEQSCKLLHQTHLQSGIFAAALSTQPRCQWPVQRQNHLQSFGSVMWEQFSTLHLLCS